MSTIAAHIPGEPDAGTKVTIVIMRQRSCRWMTDCLQSEIGSTQRMGLSSNQVEIFIPPQAEIQRQVASEFPVILEIDAKHFGAALQIKIRISCSRRHSGDRSPRRKTVRIFRCVCQNRTRKICKVNFQRRIKLKEPAELPLPNIVKTSPEGVITSGDRKIILQLIFSLIGLLRHICVGTKCDCSSTTTKDKGWDLIVSIYQVVPILIAYRGGVNDRAGKNIVKARLASWNRCNVKSP